MKEHVMSNRPNSVRMKEHVMSIRPNSVNSVNSVSSGQHSKLRHLHLSFEGKDIVFKNGELDNGRLPHGGYKGSRKHPIGIYSFHRGHDFQSQLRHDLDRMLENDVLEIHGSPTWALETHRQHTHSGESPLLLNHFLASSRHDSADGTARYHKDSNPLCRSAPAGSNGGRYYRPNRLHQYLTATELKDAADCPDVVRYGRPTRTTLLRARLRDSPSSNAYEVRRQSEQRLDGIRTASLFSNPREVAQLQREVEGESIHSFITGARYNRAHCLDAKSVTHYGVYMPRDNPLGCFVIGHKIDALETTSAPPDSPRSDSDDKLPSTLRRRPTTAPGYGYGQRRKQLSPRHAWGDASSSLHITNGLNAVQEEEKENGAPVPEGNKTWGPKLNLKGKMMPLNFTREGAVRFESKLPSVHGTSLSKLMRARDSMEDNSDTNQPPPSPVPTSARQDTINGHIQPSPLPHVKQDAETAEDRKSADKPELESEKKPVPKDVEEVHGQETKGVNGEKRRGGAEVSGDQEVEGETAEKEEEAEADDRVQVEEQAVDGKMEEELEERESERKADEEDVIADGVATSRDITTSYATGEQLAADTGIQNGGQEDSTKPDPFLDNDPTTPVAKSQQTEAGFDVTFFLTEGDDKTQATKWDDKTRATEGDDLKENASCDDFPTNSAKAAVNNDVAKSDDAVADAVTSTDDVTLASGSIIATADDVIGEEHADHTSRTVAKDNGDEDILTSSAGSTVCRAGSTESTVKKSLPFSEPEADDLTAVQAEDLTAVQAIDLPVDEDRAVDLPVDEDRAVDLPVDEDRAIAENDLMNADTDAGHTRHPSGEHTHYGPGQDETDDREPDDLGQGQGENPFTVIVTHIEMSMGAPAPKVQTDEEPN